MWHIRFLETKVKKLLFFTATKRQPYLLELKVWQTLKVNLLKKVSALIVSAFRSLIIDDDH